MRSAGVSTCESVGRDSVERRITQIERRDLPLLETDNDREDSVIEKTFTVNSGSYGRLSKLPFPDLF